MTIIRKEFSNITDANTFLFNLYDAWDQVTLIQSPWFSEEGTYIWEVKNHGRTSKQDV